MIKEILKDDYIYKENSTEDSISKLNHNFKDLDDRKVENVDWKTLSTNAFTFVILTELQMIHSGRIIIYIMDSFNRIKYDCLVLEVGVQS